MKHLIDSPTLSRQQLHRWSTAVFVVFFVCGVSISSWMARLPRVRDLLQASTFEMGLLVVGLSGGSIIGLVMSSHVIARIGATRTIAAFLTLMLAGLAVVGLGTLGPSYLVIFVGLAMYGIGTSTTDVAMNLSGAANERAVGRSLMPLFHALFSLGTMVGAGIGALLEHAGVAVIWHLLAVVVAGGLATAWSIPRLQSEAHGLATSEGGAGAGGWRERLSVWKQPATLLIGLVVLGTALAEGSAGDWLALAMVDDRGTSNATGAVIYGVFVTAMTIGRVSGVMLIDRFGRVPVVRGTAVLGVFGLALVIVVPNIVVGVIGTVLWGLGASLGFPIGMSAAADDPRHATARVSAVATIGYLAFLVGPPGIGLLGEHVGLLRALTVVLVLIAVVAVVAPAVREPASASAHPR